MERSSGGWAEHSPAELKAPSACVGMRGERRVREGGEGLTRLMSGEVCDGKVCHGRVLLCSPPFLMCFGTEIWGCCHMQKPGRRSKAGTGGLRYASSHTGTRGDYSHLSRKAKFHCKCIKYCRAVSLGSSHVKRSPWSPPALPVLGGAGLWGAGANLCWQLHIWAVPAADASPGAMDASWGRRKVSNPCWQRPPSLPPQPGSCGSRISRLRSARPLASPPVPGGLSPVCQHAEAHPAGEPWAAPSPAVALCLRQSRPSCARSRPSAESIRGGEAARQQ